MPILIGSPALMVIVSPPPPAGCVAPDVAAGVSSPSIVAIVIVVATRDREECDRSDGRREQWPSIPRLRTICSCLSFPPQLHQPILVARIQLSCRDWPRQSPYVATAANSARVSFTTVSRGIGKIAFGVPPASHTVSKRWKLSSTKCLELAKRTEGAHAANCVARQFQHLCRGGQPHLLPPDGEARRDKSVVEPAVTRHEHQHRPITDKDDQRLDDLP